MRRFKPIERPYVRRRKLATYSSSYKKADKRQLPALLPIGYYGIDHIHYKDDG